MSGTLETTVNMDENYQDNRGQYGRISKELGDEEREIYMDGTFKQLIEYVMKSDKLQPEQVEVASAVKEKILQDSPNNKILIKLYDENDEEFEGQFHPGDIYLGDTVRNRIADDANYIKMGIAVRPGVG